MFRIVVLFLAAAIVGYRRGVFDGKAVAAITAISLFVAVIAVVGWATFTPRAPSPGATLATVAFLGYFLPLLAGFGLGVIAKRQRIKNDTEGDGAA